MISWRMAAAWVAALVVATVLTWQIVGLADSQVGETPLAVSPSFTTTSTAAVSTTSTAAAATTTTSPDPTTTTTPNSTTTTPGRTTTGPSPTTTTPTATSSSSSSSSTTSSVAAQWSVRTLTSSGGSVVVRYRPGEVELQAATPAPGFSVEVDDPGPPRVRVEFESDESDARVEARWDNGSLDVDIDESG